MRTALFTDTFLPQINGVVTSIINLSKGLADRGHKIYIMPLNSKILTNLITLMSICAVPLPAFFYENFKFTLPVSPAILEYILNEKIELIHFQTPITLGFQAIILARLLKIPLVGSFHTFFCRSEVFETHTIQQQTYTENCMGIFKSLFESMHSGDLPL